MGTGEFLTRHFRRILDGLETGDLGNVAWIPGAENPADGLTKEKSDLGPLFHLLEPGIYQPGRLERPRGYPFYLHNLPIRVGFRAPFLLLAAEQ